uniref:Lamin Dm0 n=1 Tax=Schistosoma haematobium TaxID=6185 RepID=A0A094ZM56_SCHHA
MSARARKQKAVESEKNESSPTSFSRSVTIERSHTSSSGSPRKSYSRSERSSSPLTISRSEEKDELAHLNDRLAGYIDYVRKLELDKQKLTRRIQTVTEERMEREKLVERSLYIEEEVEGRKQAEYESRLTEELRSIRDQTASELEEYKIQMEETFESKLGQLKSSANFSAEDASRQRSELLIARKRADELSHDLSKKIAELELLQRRVADLERQLTDERKDFESQLLFQRQEVNRLKEELEESFREFTDLMNTKIALDQEILMYRKMLEGEESRLNLTPAPRDSPFNIPVKRRRVDGDFEGDESNASLTGASYSSSRTRFAYRVSSTARGPVEFFKEQDTHGKWIKIHNSSNDEMNLGGWELVHEADGHETRFKFSRAFSLKPGALCTIWSQDAEGNSHNPPADLTMKNKSFHPGTDVTILLLDADGEEQAKCTVKREKIRPGVNFDRKSGVRAHDENFRGNQEACEKMLDAVRELGSFIVQRQNTSPISHHIRPTKDMQSRFPMRVRSKSTTHDDSISHKRNLTVRVGHSLKSVRRPTSLTKRSKSPIKRSVSPYPVIDTENSCCSKHSGHSKGVDIFSQRETKYRFPVKNDTFIASKQETENVQASEDFTNPEIACLEAELSHRDTLIKYLSEQLFKLYQDNDRIFAEYELQEANLTKYLHSLRSRLTETNSNLNQQYTTHNNTTNNTNSIHTDYITHITQSISQDIHINITDSILHHFAKEINDKIINPGINNNNNNDNDVIVTMNPVQRIEQSFISELQDLNLATQNLLNYWEIKNHQMNYPIVCQQFFNALLNFCIISMNSYQLNNQFIDPNIKDLQMKADHAEQQIIDLSNEIKQYQYQLNQLNEKLQKNQLEETNHHLLISDYFLSSTNSSSNNNNIITYLSDTDQTQCILSSPSSSSLLLLDPGSSSQTYESIPKIKSIDDQTIFPLKSTIMPIDISTTTTTTTTTTTIPVDNSINNLLQRLWGMLSKESKLFSTDVHKSKLWISNKEDYDTLYEAYNIIEQFQWYIQNNKLSSFKSSSLVESQSSLSTTATYFAPELVANEINRTTATDKSIPVEVSSITSLTDQSTITALTSNQHKIKDIEEVNLESFKMKELSSCTNYATKSIYLTDMCTSTSDLLTLFINKDQNHQLNIQQVKQMNDQIISTDDLIQTSSLEKEALRELQRKFNYLKDSYNHLVSQYQTFNQTLCKQLKYVNLTFDEYKSNISVYISHKYKNVCDSSIQTDSFNHLPRLTDPSYRQIPLDYRNLYEVEYCHSLWPTNEVISNESIIYNQSMLNTELTTDNCSFELSQLKQDYEILQSKLQKSEREVEMLHNNLLDIENHIKLAISNNHFTSLQCILDNGGLSNVQSLTKAFLNQVSTIISNLNQYIPDQDNQIEYESPDHYLTDDKSFPIHSAKRLLVNTEEYDQKYPLYSAEQSLIRLTELQEILQQQIIRKQDTFVEQIEQDNYSFNQEIDRLLDDKPEITDLNLTEKLQSALHVIYEELSLCQHLVDKLLSEKTKHCKLIAMQASQIEDLNKELRDYDYKLKAISTGHNIVPHNSDETYENKCYERNDEKVKSECYIYHHNQYPNSLIDSSTNPNKNIINELKLTNQTETEQTTIMSKEEKEYLTIAKIEETKSTLDKDTLTTSEFTVEMTREKLVSSSLCEDESNVVGQLREELTSCYEQIVKLSRSVEESDASLMDVRRLLTVKESEVADLREEKRHLRDEVNELRETVEAERRDLDIMRANMDVLERKKEVSDLRSRRVILSDYPGFCDNSGVDGVHCIFLHDELSDLKQKFSRISMSLAFATDFVNLCMRLLSGFVNLLLDLSRFSNTNFDRILCADFIDLLSDIVSDRRVCRSS